MSRKVMSELSRRDLFRGAAVLRLALTVTPDPAGADRRAGRPRRAPTRSLRPMCGFRIATGRHHHHRVARGRNGPGHVSRRCRPFSPTNSTPTGRRFARSRRRNGTRRNYGNPGYNGVFQTLREQPAVRGYFQSDAHRRRQARRVLIDAVAAQMERARRPVAFDRAQHRRFMPSTGRRISYGEIAGFAKAPAELPKIEDKDLKPASQFRLIGKDVSRVDVPLKVRGCRANTPWTRRSTAWSMPRSWQSPYPGGAACHDR